MSSEPVRQQANDLVAFDISRQSPEQIAKLFVGWKERRERLQAPGSQSSARPPHLRPVPPVAHAAAQEAEATAPTAVAGIGPGGPVRYSAPFEALLAAREPALAQRLWSPGAGLRELGRPHAPRRRSRTKMVFAGAASVVAAAAVAAGGLWEQSAGWPGWMQAGDEPAADTSLVASPAEAALPATPIHPTEIPLVEPFAATASALPVANWPQRQAVDLALMKEAPVSRTAQLPLMPRLKPPVPVAMTASKPSAKPAAPPPGSEDEPGVAAIAPAALPLAPSVTTATVSVPIGPASEARNDDPRADGINQRGDDKNNYTFGTNNNRMASSSSSKPTTGKGSGSADPGSGGTGGDAGGSGDPGSGDAGGGGSGGGDSGGGSGGGRDAGGGDSGGDGDGGDSGGGDAGGGDSGGGDSGGGSGGGGDAGGDGGGGDSGGGDAGGEGGSGGGDTGGGGESGGDSEGGDSEGGDSDGGDSDGGDSEGGEGSEGGESGEGESGEVGECGEGGSGSSGGIGGAIGGALGGLGDALGGALGGGKGNANGKDKDDN